MKINDKAYKLLYEELLDRGRSPHEALNHVFKSGYITERQEHEFSPLVVTGDYFSVIGASDPEEELAVLLLPGSFDPLHEGHLASLRNGKAAVENAGYKVAAGIVSPSHDDYVRRRKNLIGGSAYERNHQNAVFLREHPYNQPRWIIQDLWESEVSGEATNFTTVVRHIQTVVRNTTRRPVTVFMMFGSDNEFFYEPLLRMGPNVRPLLVHRDQYPVSNATLALIQAGKILDTNSHSTQSSTAVRLQTQPEPAYLIRKDAKRAGQVLASFVDDYDVRLERFSAGLHKLLQSALRHPVVGLDLEEQEKKTQQYLDQYYPDHALLNNDIYFVRPQATVCRISRLFRFGSDQGHSEKLVGLIPDIDHPVVFIDDDVASGATVAWVKKQVEVVGVVSMLKASYPYPFVDIVDERDFLVGAKFGGLLLDIGQEKAARFPYLHPFVNLHTRASIPFEKYSHVVPELWRLNAEFYEGSQATGEEAEIEFMQVSGAGGWKVADYCYMMYETYRNNRVGS